VRRPLAAKFHLFRPPHDRQYYWGGVLGVRFLKNAGKHCDCVSTASGLGWRSWPPRPPVRPPFRGTAGSGLTVYYHDSWGDWQL
jgi:hypothetical protein